MNAFTLEMLLPFSIQVIAFTLKMMKLRCSYKYMTVTTSTLNYRPMDSFIKGCMTVTTSFIGSFHYIRCLFPAFFMVSLKVHLHGVHINYRDSLKVVDV